MARSSAKRVTTTEAPPVQEPLPIPPSQEALAAAFTWFQETTDRLERATRAKKIATENAAEAAEQVRVLGRQLVLAAQARMAAEQGAKDERTVDGQMSLVVVDAIEGEYFEAETASGLHDGSPIEADESGREAPLQITEGAE